MVSSAEMVFKLLFYIFACEKCINCAIVDLSGEAMDLLKSYGIENPTSNERKVAKHFVLEKLRVDDKIYQKEEQIRNLTQDVKELSNRNGRLESEKNDIEFKLKAPLVARTRIEVLRDDLFPKNMRKPESIRECMIIILKSGSPAVRKLYDEVLTIYGREDPEKSIQLFAAAAERIFGSTSGVAAHNIMDSNILNIFRNGSEETIIRILDMCKVPYDDKYIRALRVISMKLPIPEDAEIYEGTLSTYKCVEIKPSTKKESADAVFDGDIEESEVHAFFPTTNTKIEDVKFDRNSKKGILSITVYFDDVNAAVVAFNENLGWLKKRKAAVRIISCPMSSLSSQPSNEKSSSD